MANVLEAVRQVATKATDKVQGRNDFIMFKVVFVSPLKWRLRRGKSRPDQLARQLRTTKKPIRGPSDWAWTAAVKRRSPAFGSV